MDGHTSPHRQKGQIQTFHKDAGAIQPEAALSDYPGTGPGNIRALFYVRILEIVLFIAFLIFSSLFIFIISEDILFIVYARVRFLSGS